MCYPIFCLVRIDVKNLLSKFFVTQQILPKGEGVVTARLPLFICLFSWFPPPLSPPSLMEWFLLTVDAASCRPMF